MYNWSLFSFLIQYWNENNYRFTNGFDGRVLIHCSCDIFSPIVPECTLLLKLEQIQFKIIQRFSTKMLGEMVNLSVSYYIDTSLYDDTSARYDSLGSYNMSSVWIQHKNPRIQPAGTNR